MSNLPYKPICKANQLVDFYMDVERLVINGLRKFRKQNMVI